MRYYNAPKGYRPLSNWNMGELFAPYAIADVIEVFEDCLALKEKRLPFSGLWRIVAAYSISEEDDWYFRASPLLPNKTTDWQTCSDRLHVLNDYPPQVNYLDKVLLLETSDPEGLQRRQEVLAKRHNQDQEASSAAWLNSIHCEDG